MVYGLFDEFLAKYVFIILLFLGSAGRAEPFKFHLLLFDFYLIVRWVRLVHFARLARLARLARYDAGALHWRYDAGALHWRYDAGALRWDRAESKLWRSQSCGGAKAVAEQKAVAEPKLWRSQSCGGAKAVAEPKLWRNQSCGGAKAVAERTNIKCI